MVYVYYTARRKSDNRSFIGVATAKSPTDEFTDHGVLVEHGIEAIDAFVFNDGGQLYITFKAYGLENRPIEIIGSKLSSDGLSLEGELFTMLIDEERIGLEGQYHFKQGDYYYIVYAARGCCGPNSDYDVRVARAKSFAGPYEKFEGNPIMSGGNGDFLSAGHGTGVMTSDGRHFFVCHAYLKGDNFFLGRVPIMQEMYVGDDNWVHFRSGATAMIEQPMPFSETIQKQVSDFSDNFEDEKLKVNWTWNYTSTDVKTMFRNGKLQLSGTPKNDRYAGTVLCLRPSTVNYTYETRVTNSNESMKGLTMYGDDRNFVAWGAIGDKLMLKTFSNGEETIVYESALPENIYVKIEVQRGRFLDFYKSENGKQWAKVNEEPIDSGNLVRWDRVARPGLIHIGDVSRPAEFSYFKLKNI
jgi:beta-xylosidase